MESGFTTYKDILDVIVVPLTLALLAILFPAIKSWHIRRRFKRLILRELQEIQPFPKEPQIGEIWSFHQQKKCIHKQIINESSENRDFILSLPPTLVYYISNLWDPENMKDKEARQWLHYLLKLKEYFQDEKFNDVCDTWVTLVKQYEEMRIQKL